jgi:hypothetical protein
VRPDDDFYQPETGSAAFSEISEAFDPLEGPGESSGGFSRVSLPFLYPISRLDLSALKSAIKKD